MPKILIIEDEATLADMYKLKLEKNGFEVIVLNNAIIALEYLKANSVDMILLDIMMPAMSGFEFLEQMNKEGLKIKTVMFTNIDSQPDMRKARELGAMGYITKANNTPREVVEKVQMALSSKNHSTWIEF